jgi:hypothetical protein
MLRRAASVRFQFASKAQSSGTVTIKITRTTIAVMSIMENMANNENAEWRSHCGYGGFTIQWRRDPAKLPGSLIHSS